MPQRSAGLLLYNGYGADLMVVLVHSGGPFWRNREGGAWQIPKGLIAPGETSLAAAIRETAEELGTIFTGEADALGEIPQAGGKYVEAFAMEALWNPDTLVSNDFEIEWPPRSGRQQFFPEVDAARWFGWEDAYKMMLASQRPFLDRLRAFVMSPANRSTVGDADREVGGMDRLR